MSSCFSCIEFIFKFVGSSNFQPAGLYVVQMNDYVKPGTEPRSQPAMPILGQLRNPVRHFGVNPPAVLQSVASPFPPLLFYPPAPSSLRQEVVAQSSWEVWGTL